MNLSDLPTLDSTEFTLLDGAGRTFRLYELTHYEQSWNIAHPLVMNNQQFAALLLEHLEPLIQEYRTLEAEFEKQHGLSAVAAENSHISSDAYKTFGDWFNDKAGDLYNDALPIVLKRAGFFLVETDVSVFVGHAQGPDKLREVLRKHRDDHV